MTGTTRAGAVAPARYSDAVGSLEIASLRARYLEHELTPAQVIEAIYARIPTRGEDSVWISIVARERAMERVSTLPADPASLPLWGIPFAIKDNIDVLGMPTTAGCVEFAYVAEATATLVTRLENAGAILIGKTNLDQFATGLNGTRSPYGIPTTPFNPAFISGGSSSGSAVAVAAGLVAFSIGTDTAGSGRVPAGFNNIVGVKPSRGLGSNSGIVPACRSLDCASIFALTVADSSRVLAVIAGKDAADPWSRTLPLPPVVPRAVSLAGLTFAVPAETAMTLSPEDGYDAAWLASLAQLRAAGATLVEIDMAPFLEAGELLYNGPWLAERLSGLQQFVEDHPEDLHPVVRTLLESGLEVTGSEVFRGLHDLLRLRTVVAPLLASVDGLLVPTAPRTFTVDEMLAQPIERNAALGTYTTFGNLLDLAAVAVPAQFTASGLPFGVTVLGSSGSDERLLGIAASFEAMIGGTLGATGYAAVPTSAGAEPPASSAHMRLVVVGAHLSGMPLNIQLASLGAVLESATTTAPEYAFYALAATVPPKPGLVRVGAGGAAIEVEVYRLPKTAFGEFILGVGSPLSIGTVRLADGSSAHGFLCEPAGLDGARDITSFGGWRSYVESLGAAS